MHSEPLSQRLRSLVRALPPNGITLSELVHRVGNDGLYGCLAARLGTNEPPQEGNGVFHQIAIRASRRFSSLIRLNVV